MLFKAGQLFRLTKDIMAIRPRDNRLGAVIIPSGDTVLLVKSPSDHDDRLVDISWDGNPARVFGRDLFERGKEVTP